MKRYRKMQFKAIMVVWGMVFLGFFVFIPSKSMAQKPEYMVLGLIGAFTGAYAPVIGPVCAGAEDGVKYVNEELGGIDGVKIKLENRDMQGNVALGLQQYAGLMESKPKPLFVAIVHAGISEALREKLLADGAIGLSQSTTVPCIYPRANTYGLSVMYPEAVALPLNWVKDNWKEGRNLRLGIITWDSAYGRGFITDEFFDYCKKIGVDIVGTELFKVGEVDVTTQMTRLRAKKPDWLATQCMASGPISILKAAKEMGWKIKLLGGYGLDEDTAVLDPELMEGSVGMHSCWPLNDRGHPGIKLLLRYMEKNKRTKMEQRTPYIYGWTMPQIMHKVVKDAVAKVGWSKLNLDAIKYEMNHLDFEPQNGLMKLAFTEKRPENRWCYVHKIQDGKAVVVSPGGGYVNPPDLMPARFR